MKSDTTQSITGSVMVVGSGISGIQAALDLADSGFYVHLIEQSPAIGGEMAKLDKTFPTNDCSMWIISPKLVEVGRHLNIELHTLSTVTSLTGKEGDFTVTIHTSPRFVDMDKCIACGECAKKCPGKTPDEFNENLIKRKAIHVPYPQAVPLKYSIDPEKCLYLEKEKCGNCKKVCPTDAINFDDTAKDIELKVGAVVVTTGFKAYDPSDLDFYQKDQLPNVVTSMEFERLLSAGGPTAGHVKRPSDDREPSKIAWLQCVGSRDINRSSNSYCSSVCCMYAVKEAVIAKEHAGGDLEPVIFYMDFRSHGKEFERYYERAKHDGVRFVRSRVHTITEIPDNGSLELRYVTEDGGIIDEVFDMVVLSVGMEPHDSIQDIAGTLGIELNGFNFIDSKSTAPSATSVPGIYVAGPASGPKDIPQSVMEASAAACSAGISLNEARGTRVSKKTFPEELPVPDDVRTGVFVCNCGVNIGGIADVPSLVEKAKSLDGVVFAEEQLFSCSQDSQERMVDIIREKKLNRVVVAACTPRTHEPLFQETLRNSGLNPYLFEMANIRNQCTWVHSDDKKAATNKSYDLIRMAVSRATQLEPITDMAVGVESSALVVGCGAAGMTAGLSLADQGFPVTIIDKDSEPGGSAKNIKKTWIGEDAQEFLKGMVERVRNHPNISLHLNSEIRDVSGFVGNFETTVLTEGVEKTIQHGAGIIATGGLASRTNEYLYGKDSRVTKWHELENTPEKIENADSIVFIQCVGSRDEDRPYCSRICCTSSVAKALSIKESYPEKQMFVLYRDIRTYAEREVLYQKARDAGVIFIQYEKDRKPVVAVDGESLAITVFDHVLRQDMEIRADLVNLATAVVPSDTDSLSAMYKLPLNEDRFFMEAHAKLRPVDFATDGMYVCGTAHYPKPLEECISQAKAAAARAATVLSKSSVSVSPLVSQIDRDKCIGCGLCSEVCSFGAISLTLEEGKGLKAETISASCKGCGVCAASCPQTAIDMFHFRHRQIVASLEVAY